MYAIQLFPDGRLVSFNMCHVFTTLKTFYIHIYEILLYGCRWANALIAHPLLSDY